MADRENAIKRLKYLHDVEHWTPSESNDEAKARRTITKEAIELLKAQEPRKPHYTTLGYVVNGKVMSVKHPECPRCWDNGLMLWDAEIEDGSAYCKRCGQAVKWK